MSIIRRRRKSADPTQVIDHLVQATMVQAMIGTDESAKRAAAHINADLDVLDRTTLKNVAGHLIIEASHQSVNAIKSGAMDLIQAILADAEEPADAPDEAPEALGEPEDATGAQAAADAWTEDRR